MVNDSVRCCGVVLVFAVVGLSSSADDCTAMVWSFDGAAGFDVEANDVRRLVQAVEGVGVDALVTCGPAPAFFSEVSVVADPADEKRADTRSVALDAARRDRILWRLRRERPCLFLLDLIVVPSHGHPPHGAHVEVDFTSLALSCTGGRPDLLRSAKPSRKLLLLLADFENVLPAQEPSSQARAA